MPTNDREYQKRYGKKHYAANKQKYVDQAAARRKKLTEEVRLLKSKPCADCGEEYGWWIMQFDHIDPSNKQGDISFLVNRCARKKVMEEIEKCEVVCGNCHLDREHKRRASVV